jgi:hypothetical protein
MCSETWMASSRVGARTTACGRDGQLARRRQDDGLRAVQAVVEPLDHWDAIRRRLARPRQGLRHDVSVLHE